MTDPALAPWLAGLFGLVIGSFLNVCIARLPWDYSVVQPGSHCPRCGRFLAWWENIPVLSWLLLRARCRTCKASISWRYPAVELATGLCFWWAVREQGAGWAGLRACAFGAILIDLIVTDLDWRILPDEFTIGGWYLGLALAAIEPLPPGLVSFFLPDQSSARFISFAEALAASFALAGGLAFVGWAYARYRGREGLGFGDVKMLGTIGAFLGLERGLLVILLGSLGGTVLGVLWIKLRGRSLADYELPFGSFLGIAALWVSLFPPNQP